jgi:hypothetical protein
MPACWYWGHVHARTCSETSDGGSRGSLHKGHTELGRLLAHVGDLPSPGPLFICLGAQVAKRGARCEQVIDDARECVSVATMAAWGRSRARMRRYKAPKPWWLRLTDGAAGRKIWPARLRVCSVCRRSPLPPEMSWKRCNIGLNPNGIKLGISIDLFHGFSWMLVSPSISCMYVVSKTPPYRRSPDGP